MEVLFPAVYCWHGAGQKEALSLPWIGKESAFSVSQHESLFSSYDYILCSIACRAFLLTWTRAILILPGQGLLCDDMLLQHKKQIGKLYLILPKAFLFFASARVDHGVFCRGNDIIHQTFAS